MAEVIWTDPALADLDAVAGYIALYGLAAATELVDPVLIHADQLGGHPLSGSKLPEFEGWRYRQILEPPCRVIYKHKMGRVLVLHVARGERLLDRVLLAGRYREKSHVHSSHRH